VAGVAVAARSVVRMYSPPATPHARLIGDRWFTTFSDYPGANFDTDHQPTEKEALRHYVGAGGTPTDSVHLTVDPPRL
jgi:hypothetical protein